MAFDDEDSVKESLMDLQDQINEKETFQVAVSSIKALFVDHYRSASPSLQNSFYAIICHVAHTLETRYTEIEFWLAGKKLFEVAERQVADSFEREYLKTCIARACEHLDGKVNQPEVSESVLDGQLPMDSVPPRSTLQVAHELLATLGVVAESSQGMSEDNYSVVAGSSQGVREDNNTSERASVLMEEMVNAMEEISGFQSLIESIEASLQGIRAARPMKPPPASKQVIEKLPVITISDEIMAWLGSDMECAVCREYFVTSDKMLELPCKHLFHLQCLKPWLDKHNSCPTCRHELPTDDDAYERWKEQEREAKKNETVLQNH